MSAKLIIWIPGKPQLNGHKQREFLWSPAHSCYLYGGKEIDASEFNALYEKAVRNNADLGPRVKVLSVDKTIVRAAPPAPITTITAREVSADEAEEVLQRLRPERLKKKTGPKEKEKPPVVEDVA